MYKFVKILFKSSKNLPNSCFLWFFPLLFLGYFEENPYICILIYTFRMNRNIRYILTVIIFATSFAASKAVVVTPDTIILGNYPYVRFTEKGADIQLSDNEFYNISRKVVFPINKHTLPENSPLLKELENEVIPLINKDSLTIRRLMIRGASSPDGPYPFNKQLSEKREQSLFDFFNSRLTKPVNGDDILRENISEDYRYLCIMMRDAGDADYLKVQELCDKYLANNRYTALEEALKKVNGGKLWKRLVRIYFPELRATRFVIFLDKPEEEKEDVKMVAAEQAEGAEQTEGKGMMVVPEPEAAEEPLMKILKRRELLSIKTNLLLDGAYVPGYDRWCPIPNIAIEYYPLHGHFTFGASIDFPWWQDYWHQKYFQIRNYQLETRYYLKAKGANGAYEPYGPGQDGPAFAGWYAQAYIHGGLFNICFDADRGWEGEGIGAGVGLGYVLPISRNGHWRLEFGAQVGFFRCKYDPYQFECPVDPTEQDHLYYYKWKLDADLFQKRQYRYNWIGPTRIGVTLSYDLLYRPVKSKKRGASLKNWELKR